MIDFIKSEIEASIDVKQKLLNDVALLNMIEEVANVCIDAYKNGNKIILAGNGGSASDAQHISAELVGRYGFNRSSLSAVSLATDTSAITAIANDYSYQAVFSRQLEGIGVKGDVFIAISTSGNSKNIVEACKVAKSKGITAIGLSSNSGGDMQNFCDYNLRVQGSATARIQESHIMIGHILCALIENSLFKKWSQPFF